MAERYWVFVDGRVQGPLDVPSLRKLNGFTLLSQVCPESGQTWRVADDVIEIKSYFLSPPRLSTLVQESAPPLAAPLAQAESGMSLPTMAGGAPETWAETPERVLPSIRRPIPTPAAEIETLPDEPLEAPGAKVEGSDGAADAGGALRQVCEKCGFRNPRDVAICMKCATPIKKSASPAAKDPALLVMEALGLQNGGASPTPSPAPAEPAPAPAASEPEPEIVLRPVTPTVEVPLTRALAIMAVLVVCGALGFAGYRYWHHKHLKRKPAATKPAAVPVAAAMKTAAKPVAPSSTDRHASTPSHRAALPGVTPTPKKVPVEKAADAESPNETPGTEAPRAAAVSKRPAVTDETDARDDAPASYRVLSEATPLKHRTAAPMDSPYAKKHRADRGLWTDQQRKAIQIVQRYRVYGGQRTINRNVEILMQILRDREYNAAFETGKRPYYYDDLDWDASQTDGPVYEVRLTFSGGRENDGSPRKPLRFAFKTDLEQETVEPGGAEQVRSNTMHAFFDESRIPPDDRRAIAKDTEELVMAAQPDGSPLALDTVARHFTETYGSGAMSRVAQAYGLGLLTKKIVHEPKKVDATSGDAKPGRAAAADVTVPVAALRVTETKSKAKEEKSSDNWKPSKSGPVEWTMTPGMGREKTFIARAATSASASRVYELLTGYDRLKTFVPDVLVSEKEGQDGNAIIVHTVSLSRFLFFVFKVNLHLRVIEHPQQRTIEFERIAGEFEQFRGAVEIGSDGNLSTLTFRSTVVPKGRMPSWVLQDMAKRFMVPIIDALRARAESN